VIVVTQIAALDVSVKFCVVCIKTSSTAKVMNELDMTGMDNEKGQLMEKE
jgi:hypothetical protein